MTKEELHGFSIESLDEMFGKAEKEHEKEVNYRYDNRRRHRGTDGICSQRPECCSEKHAEKMLGILGANIMDEEVYHDEDECPNMDMGYIK